jgi:hypothetical protein
MLLGIGFLSVLIATVASQFIQTDTGSDEVMDPDALFRIFLEEQGFSPVASELRP